MTTISTGLHIVPKKRKGGKRWYVYAYRGGPQIHVQDGAKPAITPALLEKACEERRQKGPSDTLDYVIDLYTQSSEFTRLSDTTKREYRIRLNSISEVMGRVPIRMFNRPDMRQKIIQWRDTMADTPRAADRSVGMLSTLLSWAKDRPLSLNQNAAAEIKHLHKSNRADKVWTPKHWEAVKDVPPQVHRVLVLGALTGLRVTDVLSLQWEDVKEDYIETVTKKTGGEAVIPMHPELARALMGPGKGHILRNSRGLPWTTSGFQSSWNKAKPEGFDRKFHDLRGTFATKLCIAGFSDGEVADIIGWTAKRIAAIRSKYVDRMAVAKARAQRLSQEKFTGDHPLQR